MQQPPPNPQLDASTQKPSGMKPATKLLPTMPQRAMFRPSTLGVLKSTSDTVLDPSTRRKSSVKIQTRSVSAGKSAVTPLTQHERERIYAAEEWENERMDELTREIRKLMGTGKAGDEATNKKDKDEDEQRPAKTGTSEPTALNHTRKSSRYGTSILTTPASVLSLAESSASDRPVPGSDSVLDGLDLSQPLNLYRVPDGIMQVFIMTILPTTPISRAYVVVTLGDQVFQTSVAKTSGGSWNEGFELVVSYHMQLFGTIHLDVFSSNTLLPDTHVGRAEIKISMLGGFPEIFTSYYEIWEKRLSSSTVPEQRQRKILSKNLGALQVRVNYRFQKFEDPEPELAKVRGVHLIGTVPGQRINQAAQNSQLNPANMSVEDLVAGFANQYNQYIETARQQGKKALVNDLSVSAESPVSIGFSQVDSEIFDSENQSESDSMPSTPAGEAATTSGSHKKTTSTGGGWFSDWFGTQPSSATKAGDSPTKSTTASPAVPSMTPSSSDSPDPLLSAFAYTSKPDNDSKTLMQSLASMFISQSTFKAIKSLDRLVTSFNQGVELSSAELLGGFLTLYKFFNEADLPGVTRPHKGVMVESMKDLEVPGHYARFALASYGWRALYFFNRGITLMDGAKGNSDVTSVLQYLNIKEEDLLGYEFRSSEVFCPSYFVAYDRPYNAIVLVVRGTMSAEDTVVDLSCEYSKWNGGLVHSGMKASAHWLFIKVMPQIFAFAKGQGIKSIRIVGHSLGGSTAAILTIMVHTQTERLKGLGVDVSSYDIKAYCYGPAPCVSSNIAERFHDCIETYVNKDDLVPRLSYGSVSDFKRLSISASDEADNLAQRLYSPFEDTTQQQQRWKEKFERLKQIRQDIHVANENMHLSLPGVIHHIVAYRTPSGKDKSAADPVKDIEAGKRELFGIETDSSSTTGQPPTPVTKVRSDSVNPEDLADAVNSSIAEAALNVGPIPEETTDPMAPDNTASEAMAAKRKEKEKEKAEVEAVALATLQAKSAFYPVWVQRVPADVFHEIVLRPTMITDHMPSAYESAFARAIETQIREKRKK